MDYTTLVDMRFNKKAGPIDISKNPWDYSNLDYSIAGKFSGNSGKFNGTSTSLIKVGGPKVSIREDEDFTISFWINFDTTKYANRQHFIISDGNVNHSSTNNTVYLENTNVNNIKLSIVDSLGNKVQTTELFSTLKANEWNYIAIVRSLDNTVIYVNGTQKSNITKTLKSFNFDNVRTAIGVGQNTSNDTTVLDGSLDDIVVLLNAIPTGGNTITIPTTYLTDYLDPDYNEDVDGYVDKETEYSRFPAIEKATELIRLNAKSRINSLQSGLVPYLVTPKYHIGNPYFMNGKYYNNLDYHSIKIHIDELPNNMVFTYRCPDRFTETMEKAYQKKYIVPFLLFIDNAMVAWSRITITRSDDYLTFIVSGIQFETTDIDLKVLILPFPVSYSESGDLDDDAKLEFTFNKDGVFEESNDILIGTKDKNSRCIIYRNIPGNKFNLNVDMKNKITEKNIIVFDSDGYFIPKPTLKLEAGNILTIGAFESTTARYNILCVYNASQDKNEDYLARFRNTLLAKEIINTNNQTEINIPDLDMSLFEKEFETSYDKKLPYTENLNNTIDSIFGYDKNKYDSVFEEIRPVNIIEYNPGDILSKEDKDGFVTMSRDIYDKTDPNNETFPIIFENGEVPAYYKDITYTSDTFKFKPNTLTLSSTFEIAYFRNIRNQIIPLDKENKDKDDYLYLPSQYIPRDDIIVYTDTKGLPNLYPVLYELDEINDKLVLKYDKYLDTNLYIGSKRQFAYSRLKVYETTNTIFLNYKFRSCYNPDKYLVFINGRLLNSAYYRVLIPSLTNKKINYKAIYSMKTVNPTDRIDVFYVGGNATNAKGSYNGDLVIKATKTMCTRDRQNTYAVPLPFKGYYIDDENAMFVVKHGLYVNKSEYYIHQDNGIYYITFTDEDDEGIVGEEIVFLFPYYSTDLGIVDKPSESNTMQFISRYIRTTEDTNVVTFPSDYLASITNSQYIFVFQGNKLLDPSDYSFQDTDTISFNHTIPAGTDMSVVIESDRYAVKANNVSLRYSNIKITQVGQDAITLPLSNRADSYIIFKNGKVMDHKIYTVVDNILIIDHKYNDLRPGDELTFVCSVDSSSDLNNINYYPVNVSMVYIDKIDIPNFNAIKYTGNNLMLFIDGDYIPSNQYTISGNTILLSNTYAIGANAIIYLGYKTVNPLMVDYSQSVSVDPNATILFQEQLVKVTTNNQTTFTIPYPTLPYNDTPFMVMIRGVLIPESTYTMSKDATTITIDNRENLKVGDMVTFIFCHNYENTTITKSEYSIDLRNGQTVVTLPDIYSSDIDLSSRIMVFYAGVYLDPLRYDINTFTREITLKDIPYSKDNNRTFTVIFFYSGNGYNGAVSYIPQSGYLKLDPKYIDRNYNKELYMFFVNGKKIPKSQILDITNSLKKLLVNIKTRFGLEVISCSPLISEFKDKYKIVEKVKRFKVTITQSAHQTIYVKCNDSINSNTFSVEEGSTFTVTVVGDKGYTAGTLNITSGAVTEDIEIFATLAAKATMCNVKVPQTTGQVITVTCNGREYDSDFSEAVGSKYTAVLVATDNKYTVGALSSISGTLTGESMTISATPATIKKIHLSILGDNLTNQALTTTIYADDMITKVASYNGKADFTVDYGNYVYFFLNPDRGYIAGEYVGIFQVGVLHKITDDILDMTVSPASGPIYYNVRFPSTLNQTILVTSYDPENKDKTIKQYTKTFQAPAGDVFIIAVTPNDNYMAGTITTNYPQPYKLSGTLNSALIISITDAVPLTQTSMLSVGNSDVSTLSVKLSDGRIVKSGETVPVVEGTTFTVLNDALDGYTPSVANYDSGIIGTKNITVGLLSKGKKMTEADYRNMAHVIIDPKDDTSISVFYNKKVYTSSFYTKLDSELYINTTATNPAMHTELSTQSHITIDHVEDDIYITNTSPVPNIQDTFTPNIGKSGDHISFYLENPYAFTQAVQIVYKDQIYSNQTINTIPFGESFKVSVLPIVGDKNDLYINGYKIPNGEIIINTGKESDNDLENALNRVNGFAISTVLPEKNNKCKFVLSNNTFNNQEISLYRWKDGKSTKMKLPYELDLSTFEVGEFFTVIAESTNEKYIGGKCNWTVIRKPTPGMIYTLYATPPIPKEVV